MRYLKPHFYVSVYMHSRRLSGYLLRRLADCDRRGFSGAVRKGAGEFGKRLRNSIDWEEECFYQKNRRCAFLNDENLCDLYKALDRDGALRYVPSVPETYGRI